MSGQANLRDVSEVCVLRNRNTIASDSSPISPGGVRLGSCAMTTRRVDEEGFRRIGTYLVRARDIARGIQERPSRPGKSVERWTWLHW